MIWKAITTSVTWKEFREKMPRAIYDERMTSAFDENDQERPADNDEFDYESISADYEWPSNPMDDMLQFLPPEISALGRRIQFREFFTIDPSHEEEALRLLNERSFRTHRDDKLIRGACGNWGGSTDGLFADATPK